MLYAKIIGFWYLFYFWQIFKFILFTWVFLGSVVKYLRIGIVQYIINYTKFIMISGFGIG